MAQNYQPQKWMVFLLNMIRNLWVMDGTLILSHGHIFLLKPEGSWMIFASDLRPYRIAIFEYWRVSSHLALIFAPIPKLKLALRMESSKTNPKTQKVPPDMFVAL